MGSLEVFFNGICSWIPAWALRDLGDTLPDDMAWRVVLVSGVNGMSHVDSQTGIVQHIPPHDATISVGGNSINTMSGPLGGIRQMSPSTWGLRGAAFSVLNPLDPQKPRQSALPIIPSLHTYASVTPPPPPLALSPRTVIHQTASAFFDISYGTLDPQYLGDPANEVARVRYTVLTDGKPKLNMLTFFDGMTSVIEFANDEVSISLDNAGIDTDTWWDFMFHYLCCTEIPPGAYPPGPPAKDHVDGLNSGCSNSQWP